MVHPANMTMSTYTLAYDANDGTGTMTSETGLLNYEPHTIKTSTFTPPSGYEFAGWCTIQNTSATPTNPQTTCTGITYTDGGTIPGSTVTAGGSMTLYAMWAVSE